MTKIQKRYLEIIEQNDFESLPGTFYVRAFIRQYASAVGLDGNQLVDIYDGKEPAIVEEPKPVYEELEGSRKQLHDEEKAIQLVTAELTSHCLFVNWFSHCGRSAVHYVARSKSRTDYSNTGN